MIVVTYSNHPEYSNWVVPTIAHQLCPAVGSWPPWPTVSGAQLGGIWWRCARVRRWTKGMVCELEHGPVEIVDLPIINGGFP